MINILITVPKLSTLGGVSNLWNSLFLSFRDIKELNFRILEIGGHGKNPMGTISDQWNFRQNLKSDIDLAFLNPTLMVRSFFRDGLFAKQLIKNQTPFMVFFHGWELEFQQKVDTKYRKFFLNSFGHAKKIFVLSHEFKEKILEWGYEGEVVVETTAVDISLIDNFSLEKKVEHQKIKILFLSRIVREKGIFELVEAFNSIRKRIKNIELIIAGDGQDFEELKAKVASKQDIKLVGYVEGEEKIKLLQESDIFCLPSYTEGLPVALLEAMLFGLPIITTRVGGLKRFFKDKKMGYLIEPKSVIEIEEKIEMLLYDRESMKKIAQFNYKYAKKHLTNRVVSQNLYTHIKDVIHSIDIERIERYLLQDNLATYDPYDIWITNIGKKTKQLYYKNRYLGLLPAGVLTIYDLYINNRLRLGYQKQEYPIARAQASLALLNLYKQNGNKIYLKYAKKHIDWLLSNSSKGYSGYCWGINFDWVYSANDTYDKNTPFSTHTPYPLEAMVEYYHITNSLQNSLESATLVPKNTRLKPSSPSFARTITKDKRVEEAIKSVFLFLEKDIKIMLEGRNRLILSYGVEQDRIVTNANAYIMYSYALLLEFLPEKEEYIKSKIYKIYNFLISIQREDGSWLYSPYEQNTFIDCFHSAFVLKNIIKTNQIIELNGVNSVVQNGYRYIIDNFLDKKRFLFKRFSKSNKFSITKFDLYDNAEMLNLAIMLKDSDTIDRLSKSIKDNFIKNEDIASMIDIFGTQKNFNHLRWAVVPYLHALSNLKES